MRTLPELGTIYAWVAPFSTPIPSAVFLAHHMFKQFEGPWLLAFAIGIGAFIGFEAAGGACMASFIALRNSKGWKNFDLWVAALGIIGYVVSPVFVLNYGYGPLIFAALTTVGVYSGVSWFRLHVEKTELDKDKKAEIEKDLLTLKKLRAELRLRKSQTAYESDTKNRTSYECNWCFEQFESPQRYAVHKRYCKSKPL